MILSINKDNMTAEVKLYRGTKSMELDLHDLAWFTMNPDYAAIYGEVKEYILTLPIREVIDWMGKEVVIFHWNHFYLHGSCGEIMPGDEHNRYLPLADIFGCQLRNDYAFAVGEMDHAHFCIGKNVIEGKFIRN
jgi:hypothetical protein